MYSSGEAAAARALCQVRVVVMIAVLAMAMPLFAQTLPALEITLSDTQASNGYYFLHPFKPGAPAIAPTHMILDRFGNLVYYRMFSRSASDFRIAPDGRMSYGLTLAGPATSKFYLMDSTFTVVDSVQCKNGILTDTHDMQILSNGHYLMLGYTNRTMDLSSYCWFNGNGSPGSSTASVKGGVIQELDENKNVVFQWNAFDHFQFGDVQEQWLFNPNNVDWTHCNSIAEDADGNILLSSRWFSEVTKINRQTGQVMWRLGGKRNQFTFINDPYNGTVGQHDPRRIANGNLTIYDNGRAGTPFHPARAVEYALDESSKVATLVWSQTYDPNVYSSAVGNVQRLSNGNSLITWGTMRVANVIFDVVKPDGNPVMHIQSPDTLVSYRAYNYSTLPWQLNRPSITCFTSGGNSYLDAGSGYASYRWSTGATTRTIEVTSPGTYYVFVPYGTDGYISSERKKIVRVSNPCDKVLSVDENTTRSPARFSLQQNYPNPFNPFTTINYQLPTINHATLKVYNMLGQEVATVVDEVQEPGHKIVQFDASKLAGGVYFYRLTAGMHSETKRFVFIK